MKQKIGSLCVLMALLASVSAAQTWRGAETVAVQVNDSKGRAIAGARVVLTFQGTPGETGPDVVATNTKGRAVLADLAAGPWQVEISHPDYLSYIAMVDVRRGKKPLVSASFLEASGRSLSPVKVKVSKGDPNQASPRLEARRPAGPAEPEAPSVAERPDPAPQPVEPPSPLTSTPAPPPEGEASVSQPEAMPPAPETVRATPAPEPTIEAPAEPEVAAPAPTPPAPEPVPEKVPATPSTPEPTVEAPVEPDAAPSLTPPDSPTVASPEPEPDSPVETLAEPSPAPPSEPVPTPAPSEAAVSTAPVPSADSSVSQPDSDTPAPEPTVIPESEEPTSRSVPIPTVPSESLPVAADELPVAEPPVEAPPTPETPPSKPASEAPVASVVADDPTPAAPPSPPVAPPTATTASLPPTDPGAFVTSHSSGTCSDCATAEWTLQVSSPVPAVAPGSSARCAGEVLDAAQAAMQGLSTSIQLELSGFIGPLVNGSPQAAVEHVESDLAAAFDGDLAPFVGGRSPCQIVGLVLPKEVRFSRVRLAASDLESADNCSPGQPCPIGDAIWLGNLRVERGPSATVVYGLFENRSTDRGRRAILVAYYRPPNASWKARLPAE